MNPTLLVLDDWEHRLQASSCWSSLDSVEVVFADKPVAELDPSLRSRVQFLLAMRERSRIDGAFLKMFPQLRLILQTGGHAYHVDKQAVAQRGILVALGRRATAPLTSVPELTLAFMLGAVHRVAEGDRAIRAGVWPGLLGPSSTKRRLRIA